MVWCQRIPDPDYHVPPTDERKRHNAEYEADDQESPVEHPEEWGRDDRDHAEKHFAQEAGRDTNTSSDEDDKITDRAAKI